MRLVLTMILAMCIGCGSSSDGQPYRYSEPESIDDGWETATLSDVGMREQPLVSMMGLLNNISNHEIHSVIIIKDGFLVFEDYFRGYNYCYTYECMEPRLPMVDWDMHSTHNVQSVTKSYTSTLIGIAIDQGYISGTHEAAFDYLSDYSEIWSPQKGSITIEHLLTMSSGLAWNETHIYYGDPDNDVNKTLNAADPIRFILSKSMAQPPGAVFNYSGGDTNLLGQIVREATGKTFTEFANEVLFEPLGIRPVSWRMIGNNKEYVSSSLLVTPREMAKFGYVFVNDGLWKNQQIVSSAWIDLATQTHVSTESLGFGGEGYGFQWWTTTFRVSGQAVESFMAVGWGGQQIICIPQLNMVVVFTGADYMGEHLIQPEMLMGFILDAAL